MATTPAALPGRTPLDMSQGYRTRATKSLDTSSFNTHPVACSGKKAVGRERDRGYSEEWIHEKTKTSRGEKKG